MTSPNNPDQVQDDWPGFPKIEANDPQAKLKEILFQAQVDLVKAKRIAKIDLQKVTDTNLLERQKKEEEVEPDREKAKFDADVEIYKSTITQEQELEKAVHAAYIEIAKGQIDRIQVRADFVQKAAAAIVTLYTGVLTLVFAVEKNPLPVRGLIPAIFFGLAIVFSATYFAFVTRPKNMPHAQPANYLPEKQQRRLDRFIEWSRAPALHRRYFLQLSVLCLGAGVMFLPAAFLQIDNWIIFLLAGLALLAAFMMLGVIWVVEMITSENRKNK